MNILGIAVLWFKCCGSYWALEKQEKPSAMPQLCPLVCFSQALQFLDYYYRGGSRRVVQGVHILPRWVDMYCIIDAPPFKNIPDLSLYYHSTEAHTWYVLSFLINTHICDFLGLQVLYTLLKNIENESASQSFYQTYYIMIVQHVLSVVTDTSHTASLSMHATILAHMFSLADTGKISEPLFNASEVQYPSNEVW